MYLLCVVWCVWCVWAMCCVVCVWGGKRGKEREEREHGGGEGVPQMHTHFQTEKLCGGDGGGERGGGWGLKLSSGPCTMPTGPRLAVPPPSRCQPCWKGGLDTKIYVYVYLYVFIGMFLYVCICMCVYDHHGWGRRMPNGIVWTTDSSQGATKPPPSRGQFDEPSASSLTFG